MQQVKEPSFVTFKQKKYCEAVAFSKNYILAGWYKSLMLAMKERLI